MLKWSCGMCVVCWRNEAVFAVAEMAVDGIFDIDIHLIPERKDEPAHFHYDVRYVLRANGSLNYTVSDESHDLRWVKLDDVKTLTTELSMMRMVAKWCNHLSKSNATISELMFT